MTCIQFGQMWQMMHLNLLQSYPVAIYNSTDFILLVVLYYLYELAYSFPCGSAGKESSCNAGELGLIPGFDPWVGKIPWRRERLPTLVFWPGEFHGLYSLWGWSQRVGHDWETFTFSMTEAKCMATLCFFKSN